MFSRFNVFAYQMLLMIAIVLLLIAAAPTHSQENEPTITRIATGLENPRGVAIMPDGRLLVIEAGMGYSSRAPQPNTGRLSIFEDTNNDGDYDDPGEITPLLENLPGYNALAQSNPGRDEITGAGDVLILPDGRIFYTQDDNFVHISIIELSADFEVVGDLITHGGSLNAIVYDPERELIYVAESSFNSVSAVTLQGEISLVEKFENLARDQQAVPAGLALDPTTGDLIVALFSGQLFDYYGELLSFMPGEAKVVRLDPETGEWLDEITGLTTAVDVAVDESGNLFIVEMTTRWPPAPLDHEFDLLDPDGPPDDGGYSRFSGRITMYPAGGGDPVRLVDGLDVPTNITYHDGALYVSTGQGTPGRPIFGPDGLTRITGEIFRIIDYLP